MIMRFHWGTPKNPAKLCIYGEFGMMGYDGQMEWTERGHSRPLCKLYGISFGRNTFIGIMRFGKGDHYSHPIANK
jgi:hypothetical protein